MGALSGACLIGLAVRGRLRLGWSFGLYLSSIVVFNVLMGFWRDRFLTWGHWLAFELTHATLKIALALELSFLLFRAFPAAGRLARFGLAGILVAASVWIASANPTSLGVWIRVVMPQVKCGEALLFMWLLMVVLWYRIPLHPLHKAILMALAPYLLVFSVGLQALQTFEFAGAQHWGYLNTVAFIGVLGSWIYAAWRPEERSDVHPGVAKTVQPWA